MAAERRVGTTRRMRETLGRHVVTVVWAYVPSRSKT